MQDEKKWDEIICGDNKVTLDDCKLCPLYDTVDCTKWKKLKEVTQ